MQDNRPSRGAKPMLLGATCAIAAAALILLPEAAAAQGGQIEGLPNFTKAQEQFQSIIQPLFGLFRFVLVGLCIILGIWEGFKASRGQNKSWITMLLLFIVAGVALAPAGVLNLFGMNELADKVSEYFK